METSTCGIMPSSWGKSWNRDKARREGMRALSRTALHRRRIERAYRPWGEEESGRINVPYEVRTRPSVTAPDGRSSRYGEK